MNLFIQHTTVSLSINVNAVSGVRVDMETIFNELVSEDKDDMPTTCRL
ncbi:unnamed protein product, partial [Rotaria sp. Silwood1]